MVEKFLYLSKPWSYEYGRRKKKKKLTYDIVRLHSETERCSPYFSLIVRQYKWPSLSRKIVDMQKFWYHGNVTSHFSHLYGHTYVTNCFVSPNEKLIHFLSPKLKTAWCGHRSIIIIRTTDTFLYPELQTLIYRSNPALPGHWVPAVCTVCFLCVLIVSSLHFWIWSYSFPSGVWPLSNTRVLASY